MIYFIHILYTYTYIYGCTLRVPGLPIYMYIYICMYMCVYTIYTFMCWWHHHHCEGLLPTKNQGFACWEPQEICPFVKTTLKILKGYALRTRRHTWREMGEVCAEGPVGIVLTLLALHTIHPFVHRFHLIWWRTHHQALLLPFNNNNLGQFSLLRWGHAMKRSWGEPTDVFFFEILSTSVPKTSWQRLSIAGEWL